METTSDHSLSGYGTGPGAPAAYLLKTRNVGLSTPTIRFTGDARPAVESLERLAELTRDAWSPMASAQRRKPKYLWPPTVRQRLYGRLKMRAHRAMGPTGVSRRAIAWYWAAWLAAPSAGARRSCSTMVAILETPLIDALDLRDPAVVRAACGFHPKGPDRGCWFCAP